MAKVSYSDHIKKNDISVILAEILFQNLKKDHTSLPLFELAETSSGGTPDRANQSYYGGKIPWFKSGELNDSTINMSEEFITEEGLNNSSAKVFPKGTLLVAMYGATAGKTAILDIDAATNQAICAVFPKDKRIRKDFLFWFLRAHRYYYIDISRGGAQPNISQTVIKNTEVPLIDENEQKSIVEFLTRIEKSKETNYSLIPKQLHKAIKLAFEHLDCLQKLENENLNQSSCLSLLRQSILQEAIEGKLTAKWRDKHPDLISGDNHASKLLEKIKAEKERLIKERNTSTKLSARIKKDSSRAQSRGKPLAPISDAEKSFDLPEGWVWCRLGAISKKITDGTHHSPTNLSNGDYKYVTAKNIKNFGIDLTDITYVTKTVHEEIYARCNPEKGDVLYIKDGATTGIVTISNIDEQFSMLSSVALIKTLIINNVFLMYAMRSPMFFANTRADMYGVAITRVTLEKIVSSKIPLPPLAEQQAIVEWVDNLMTMINELEKQVSERKEQTEMLMQSVLREAFAG